MKPNELLEEMVYKNSEERAEAQKYIALKGIVQYHRVIDYCKVAEEKPAYKKVSDLYRYDKRLRDALYVYLSTVEEFLRACLGNEFEDNESKLIKTARFKNKQAQYRSVSLTLEQLTLKELNDMVLVNKSIFKYLYDLPVLDMNLDALRLLRNKVGHHNFLLTESYAVCSIDCNVDDTLKHNIINVMYLLPSEFKQGFVTAINNCTKNLLMDKHMILI